MSPQLLSEDALLSLSEILIAIDQPDQGVSPVIQDFALTLTAVIPFERRSVRLPWVPVSNTADDGLDERRLRAAAVGVSAVVTAMASNADFALPPAVERTGIAISAWAGHAPNSEDRIAGLLSFFDPLMGRLGRRPVPDETIEATAIRCATCALRGSQTAALLAERHDDQNMAERSIAQFAQAIHHAARAARSAGDQELYVAICDDAVHGLLGMAAVSSAA